MAELFKKQMVTKEKRMDKEFVKENEKYFEWLYNLRRSGVCNMFEAPTRMIGEFKEVNEHDAIKIFDCYCSYFSEIAEFLGIKP